MHAVSHWFFSWSDLLRSVRRRYRRALAHRLAEARLEERRLRDKLPR
jgi:hypothetical protein